MPNETELEVVGPDAATVQADAGTPAAQVAQDEGQNGIQKRINQLTAKMYEKDNTIAQLTEQLVRMSAQGVPQQQQAQPEQNLYEGLDQASAAILQKVVGNLEAKFQARVAALEGTIASASSAQIAKSQGLPDAIIQRSNELVAEWKKRGYGFNPQDAVDFAVGEAIRAGTYMPRARASNGQFAPANPVLGGQSAPAPVSPVTRKLPSDFDSLPPAKQVELLEASGIGAEQL